MDHPDGLLGESADAITRDQQGRRLGTVASAFDLPPAGDLPDNADDQAIAEIKLQLAVLKYARFARGGRVDPSSLSPIIDQILLCSTRRSC